VSDQILSLETIFTNVLVQPATKENALSTIAQKVAPALGISSDILKQGLLQREKEGTTGFTDGFAIPHTQVSGLADAKIAIFTFNNSIQWESLDGKDIEVAIVLMTPDGPSNKEHLKLLSQLSRKLMNPDFVQSILNNKDNSTNLYKLIGQIVNK
jgi:fructose PTS system EIIBC or EIIC component